MLGEALGKVPKVLDVYEITWFLVFGILECTLYFALSTHTRRRSRTWYKGGTNRLIPRFDGGLEIWGRSENGRGGGKEEG